MGRTSLDIEQPDQCIAYLREAGRIDDDETPTITVLKGGVSNRTVLIKRENGTALVLKQALEKLRVEVDWRSDPARIEREAVGLMYLDEFLPPGTITSLIYEDPDRHILGMQAAPEPHENWKTMLLAGRIEADHVRQFGEILGTIHKAAYERVDETAIVFHNGSFFDSLRIEPYYRYTAKRVTAAAPFYKKLVEEMRHRHFTVVHGDYSPKNILIHDGKLILLDHEVIHFGDPAFDLGFALTHFLSKAHHVRANRAAFSEAAGNFYKTYRQTLGKVPWADDLEGFAVRHTLACLLARVAGRSPLEYLDEDERSAQRLASLPLMSAAPAKVDELIEKFIAQLPPA